MAVEPTVAPSIIPSPDPSRLTLEVMHRELALQKELWQADLEVIRTMIKDRDSAVELLRADVTRTPTLLDRQDKNIRDFYDAKFESIKEFAAAMTSAAGKAIDAAFAAADKGVNIQNGFTASQIREAGANFSERMKANELLFGATKETLSTEINGIKERLTKAETVTLNMAAVRTEHRMETGAIVSLVVGAAVIIGVIVSIVALALRH